jgi:uncharacterized membrane protein (DUF485 family)
MVFISYTLEDEEYAMMLKDALIKENIDIMHFDNFVKPGDNIYDTITESINKCDTFIFIISNSSQKSIWTDVELTLALSKTINENVIIIPIIINNAIIPLYLENYQCLKIKDKNELSIQTKNITDSINRKRNINIPNSEINYLKKEKELLTQMVESENYKRKVKNKFQALIFSISITIFIMLIMFLNIISERSDILNSLLYGLYGLCIGIFLSITISEIRKIRRNKEND